MLRLLPNLYMRDPAWLAGRQSRSRVCTRLSAGGSWIRTLGPPATAELGAAGGRSYPGEDVAADGRQQTSSFRGGYAFSGHTESKNPVEFRPWSYEFDGNRNARAM